MFGGVRGSVIFSAVFESVVSVACVPRQFAAFSAVGPRLGSPGFEGPTVEKDITLCLLCLGLAIFGVWLKVSVILELLRHRYLVHSFL